MLVCGDRDQHGEVTGKVTVLPGKKVTRKTITAGESR